MSFKLRKQQRIKSPSQFKQVYNNKQWGNTRLLTFNALSTSVTAGELNQLGVTVSKKVSKLAVRRNQLKRLVKEFYRTHQHEIDSTLLVITVKPTARQVSNQEFVQDLEELWPKVKKWRRWANHQEKPLKSSDSKSPSSA